MYPALQTHFIEILTAVILPQIIFIPGCLVKMTFNQLEAAAALVTESTVIAHLMRQVWLRVTAIRASRNLPRIA